MLMNFSYSLIQIGSIYTLINTVYHSTVMFCIIMLIMPVRAQRANWHAVYLLACNTVLINSHC
jgi:hypothetical protein